MKIALVTTIGIDAETPMDSPHARVRHLVQAALYLGANNWVTLIAPTHMAHPDHHITDRVKVVFLPTHGSGESTFTYAESVHAYLTREPHDVAESFSQDAPLLVEQLMGSTPTVVRMGRTLLDHVSCGHFPRPVNKPKAYRNVSDRQYSWSMHTREMTSVSQASLVVGCGQNFERQVKALGQPNMMQLPMPIPNLAQETSDPGYGALVVLRQEDMLKGPDLAAGIIKALPADMDVTVIGQEKFDMPDSDGGGVRESCGSVSDADLHTLMENMSLVILPWRTTTFGLTALEAFAHGNAVAAYDVGEPMKVHWPLWSLGNWRAPDSTAVTKMVTLMESDGAGKLREGRLEFARKFFWSELYPHYMRAYEMAMANAVGQGRTNKGW